MQLTSLNDITTQHRHIFLAPHYDDVVYSCGGTLGVQVSSGLRPLIITVFGGLPPENFVPSRYASEVYQVGNRGVEGIRQAIEARRKEDMAVSEYLQADYLWLNYLDAPLRGNPSYYNSRKELIGGDVHPSDQGIDSELAQMLLELQARLPDARFYAPLGVGRHVDHQIVCSAADRLIQRGMKVYLYEEFPYVLQQGALESRKHELGLQLEPALVEMSEMLPLRLEAAQMYASQINANFGSQEALIKGITEYTHNIRPVQTVHIERYWTV